MRAGGQDWRVADEEAGTRLDKFLADASRLGSRSRAATALERGKVFFNDREAGISDASARVKAGDVVRVWEDRPGSSRPARSSTGDLVIVYEDAALIVVDKPPGLLTVPLDRAPAASSVRAQLEDYLRSQGRTPFVVHRIDRDTSGLVLFAKTESAQAALKEQFRRREPERVYWAVVSGCPEPASGTWRDHLKWDDQALVQTAGDEEDPRAVMAELRYRVIESFAGRSLLELMLVTGKRNQIRIQAALRGHALVGERQYAGRVDESAVPFPRQALHARRLAFRHPHDGRQRVFEASVPADFAELLRRLRSM